MQNGNQWQSRKISFNRNNQNQNTGGGNWVQQKSADASMDHKHDRRKSFQPGNYQGNEGAKSGNNNKPSTLAPPPAPPKFGGNVHSRLSKINTGESAPEKEETTMAASNTSNTNKFNKNQNNYNNNSNNKFQQRGGSGGGGGEYTQQYHDRNQDQGQGQQHYYNQRGGDQYHQGGQNRGNQNRMNRGGSMNYVDKIKERVNKDLSGPQYDLPPMSLEEKKFNSQCRLFIGNIPRDANIDELKAEFAKFGELGQVYFNKEHAYGFITFDLKHNAEKAKCELNGKVISGRSLTVRFAAVSTGIKVKNLSSNVSNELLEKAFNVFGPIESCRVLVDSRGKPTGEGIIIFAEKKGANLAIKKCDEDCYFLNSSLRPVIVEVLDVGDEGEGLPETSLNKNDLYRKEREIGPHFADNSSFQYEYGLRWKQLFYLYNEKKSALEHDFNAECDALAAKLSLVKHEYETEQLRRELAQREAESSYLQAEVEYRMNTASFSTFHSSMGTEEGNNYNNHSYGGQYADRGQQQYDRSYNRGGYGSSSYDRQSGGGQPYDNPYSRRGEGNFDQTYNRKDESTSDMHMLSGGTGNQMNEASGNQNTAPGRLAGRLQDRRAGDTESAAADATASQVPINDKGVTVQLNKPPPSIDSSVASNRMERGGSGNVGNRGTGLGDLNRSLNNRQENRGDLNRSLGNRQDAQEDLSRGLSSRQDTQVDLNTSLNNRQESDLNRSLSSRQEAYGGRSHDHSNQGPQPYKRVRY